MSIDPGVLKLSDGTNEINLLDLCLADWRPNVLGLKSSATVLDSPYSQGRQLVQAEFDDVTDLFVFTPKEESSDDLIESAQDVRRLLEKARNYWLTEWQDTPVYLIARGQCETNTRYAQVTNFITPEDGNPYASPFNSDSIFENWNLSITHRPWQNVAPGVDECVEVYSEKGYCISSLDADLPQSNVQIPANALINDLPTGDFTIEAWVLRDNTALNTGTVAGKTNWYFNSDNIAGALGGNLRFRANHAVTNAEFVSVDNVILNNDTWYHVAAVWDSATLTATIWLNGVEVRYTTQTTGNGAYTTDVASVLQLGNDPTGFVNSWGGLLGWVRISTAKLYEDEFIPPERCFIPQTTGDTVGIWVYEGTGATADNAEGTAAIDGAINNMTWTQGCSSGSDVKFGRGVPFCPYSLYGNGSTSNVTIPANASIDDLPTGDFTIEGWVVPSTRSITGTGAIAGKTNWLFSSTNVGGGFSNLKFSANFGGGNASYISDALLKHDFYYHIAITWDSVAKSARLWFNGLEVSYTTQTAGIGAYATDVASVMMLGNDPATGIDGWGKDMGWIRISSTQLYTATFVPPVRCELPEIENAGNTIGLWIHEGYGRDVRNVYPDSAIDGTMNNRIDWIAPCITSDYCSTPGTCEKESFFSLGSSLNQITHVFYYDASGPTYGSNIQENDSFPAPLYPDVPANGDIVYIGAQTTRINTGPFNNVIFDIELPNGPQNVYEYWNGAWVAIPNIRDTTQGSAGNFGTLAGVGGLFFEIPSDWVTTTVNGITGYFIRIRATAASIETPLQDNRKVYTVNWPWVNVEDDAVLGDISSIAQGIIYGEGRNEDEDEGIPGFQRLIMALRSDSRGEGFDPYINFSDTQNPCGITVTKEATGTWTTDIQNSATGRYLVDVAVATGWQDIVTIGFDDTVALDYYGSFRSYLEAKTSIATIQYRIKLAIGPDEIFTDPITVIDTGVIEIVELGNLELPFSDDIQNTDILESLEITIQANITTVGNQTEYYKLVLMPSDEYIIDAKSFDATEAIRDEHPLDIDSIQYPKRIIRVWQKSGTDYEYSFENDSVGAFFLQNNSNQRLFFYGGVPGTNNWNQVLSIGAVQLFGNARYHSMRGSR